jgi:hypothetical protein
MGDSGFVAAGAPKNFRPETHPTFCVRTVKLGREFSREDVSRSKDHHVSSSAVRARNAAGIQKGIMGYTASLSQQEQFVNSLVKAIVTGNTPFSFV